MTSSIKSVYWHEVEEFVPKSCVGDDPGIYLMRLQETYKGKRAGYTMRIVDGVETLEPNHFVTPENIERLKLAKKAERVQLDYTTPTQNQVLQEIHTVNQDTDSKLGTVDVWL